MRFFVCPVCGEPFTEQNRTLRCTNGHAYDLARQGYVNLLRAGGSGGARHGDDRLMVESRRAFLDSGYYAPLLARLSSWATELLTDSDVRAPLLFDAGCGEGYYTVGIRHALADAGMRPHAAGLDISREAILSCARRDALCRAQKTPDELPLELAVGSLFAIPAADGTADLIINLFAPDVAPEFHRVLRGHGLLLRAFPAEKHLIELKNVIYETPYENETASLSLDGFSLLREETLTFPLALETPQAIADLFKMTPYYYKTSVADQQKLAALSRLTVTAAFRVVAYRKS